MTALNERALLEAAKAILTPGLRETFKAAGLEWEPAQNEVAVDIARIALTAYHASEPDAVAVERAAQFLWSLLDRIDTVSDIAKGDNVTYRRLVEEIQRQRFEVGSTDGYRVSFTEDLKPVQFTIPDARSQP